MEENKSTAITAPTVTPGRSDQFTQKVLAEFGGNVTRSLEITDYQRYLIQGYFIKIDLALKTTEEARLAKKNNDNPLPAIWENVNLANLALDVIHYARMGLDMMTANHLYPIPFRNKKTNKYDITLMPGYNGIRYIAKKYAVEEFIADTIELVYSNDTFIPIKKDSSSRIDSYKFEITQPFNRGEIIGGFGYIEYADPTKNKLILMPIEAILKRKPQYASAEFWGGEKDKWEGGKKVGKEKIDGWFDEMCRKTVIREVFSPKHIPRDPEKIDENYRHMERQETQMAEIEARAEIDEYANRIVIDGDFVEAEEETAGIHPQDDEEDVNGGQIGLGDTAAQTQTTGATF
jgi:recombination protein RecT